MSLYWSYFPWADISRHLVIHFIIIVDVSRFVEVAADCVDDEEEEGDDEDSKNDIDGSLTYS